VKKILENVKIVLKIPEEYEDLRIVAYNLSTSMGATIVFPHQYENPKDLVYVFHEYRERYQVDFDKIPVRKVSL
jgi:hypothetical protein